jgi:hypothetical protein
MPLGDWYQWEGEDIKKGCRKVNVVEYYTHVLKWKDETY